MSTKPGVSTHDPSAWVFFNGEFKRYSEVHLGLMTHALHYGTGCYEGIRAYWNSSQEQLFIVHPHAHFDRMQDSARILGLELMFETPSLVETTVELLKRNDYKTDIYVRPILFKSSEGVGAAGGLSESFGIYSSPFGRFLDIDRGIRCMVSTWRRVPDIAIPVRAKVTGGYVNSNLAKNEAQRAGYDEAILLDPQDHISEGSGANIFMKRQGVFVTPQVTSDILEGITRRVVMRMLEEELGAQVVERSIDRSELYAAEEVFLCGTGAEICPVIDVDGRQVGDGKVGEATKKLQDAYFAMVRGDDPKRAAAVVPVY